MTAHLTPADYARAFDLEREQTYPIVDALEQEFGYAVDRDKLEKAASVLACPVKKHPPNWQHGRLIYAVVRAYFDARAHSGFMSVLDIGTAKGFSALCLQWALEDAGRVGQVVSIDVIDPESTEPRNTIADLDGPKTLREILAPWPENAYIHFAQSSGIDWLKKHPNPIHVAFVDGKHTGSVVRQEGVLLAARQESGDLAIFDDVHIPDVSQAVVSLQSDYKIRFIDLLPERHYAIARRR